MTEHRLRLGRQIGLLCETDDGVDIEGRVRLRPGQLVELVVEDADRPARRARVVSWSVKRLGKDGPTYHGHCQWQ